MNPITCSLPDIKARRWTPFKDNGVDSGILLFFAIKRLDPHWTGKSRAVTDNRPRTSMHILTLCE